ncbi:MAG: hypothetical protein HC788_15405 [Sphingopyxis sp.]|nr:hypothetical protein [Sphingopyxis sp.]
MVRRIEGPCTSGATTCEPAERNVAYQTIDLSNTSDAAAQIQAGGPVAWAMLIGTLLGGALGAVAGRLIDQAEDKKQCRAMVGRIEERQRSWNGGNGYGQGWYTPGYVVTTMITPAATETVETITTETHYETVSAPRARYAPKKRVYKKRAKPRCGC